MISPMPRWITRSAIRSWSGGATKSFLWNPLNMWMTELAKNTATADSTAVCLAADVFRLRAADGDLRPALEAQFARRAKVELPARAWELAALAGVEVRAVTVRNQRSRWGSCHASGRISLNWRLIHMPPHLIDYVVVHELAHMREMNHSPRFWAVVGGVVPDYAARRREIRRESHRYLAD